MTRIAFCLADGSIRRTLTTVISTVDENGDPDLSTVFCDTDETAREYIDETVHPNTHYWDHVVGDFALRAALSATWDKTSITADGVDAATLSGLPTECTVRVDGVDYAVTDGSFELSASAAGQYVVRAFHPHFIPSEWLIDAN